MRFPMFTLVSASPGEPHRGRVGWKGRRKRVHDARGRGSGVDLAPPLTSRWVVLVEDGAVVTPPTPCLYDESLAELEAATAMDGARPGVTARVGTMQRLLELPLGLTVDDFRPRSFVREVAS